MVTTEEVAQRLIVLLGEGKNLEAVQTLYAEEIETREADPARNRMGKAATLEAIGAFNASHEFRYTHIEGPLISGTHFALSLRFEAREKTGGREFHVEELAVYTVRNGLIVKEEFFYSM